MKNELEIISKLLNESNSNKLTLKEALGNLSQLPGITKNGWDRYLFGSSNRYNNSFISPQSKVEKVLTLNKFEVEPLINLIRKSKYDALIIYANSVSKEQPALAIREYGDEIIYIVLVSESDSQMFNGISVNIPKEELKDRSYRRKGEDYRIPKRSKNVKEIFSIPHIKEATKIEVYAIQKDEKRIDKVKDRNRNGSSKFYADREQFNNYGGTELKPLIEKNKRLAKEKLEKFVNILPLELRELVKSDLQKGKLDYKTSRQIELYFDNLKKSFETLKKISDYGSLNYTYGSEKLTNKEATKAILDAKKYLNSI